MDKAGTSKILALLSTAYQKFNVPKPESPEFELWHKMLKDMSYELAEAAVDKLIAESPYRPAIADIREQAAELVDYEESRVTPGEAWEKVQKAANRYGWRRKSEAMEQLPEQVRKTAEQIGWQSICHDKPGVVRAHFMKMFKQMKERSEKEKLMPGTVKNKLERFESDAISELENKAVSELENADNVVKIGSGS